MFVFSAPQIEAQRRRWFGNDCEYVRIGVRGPAYRADAKSLLGYHPRALFLGPPARSRDGRHSSKPDIFYRETRAISLLSSSKNAL